MQALETETHNNTAQTHFEFFTHDLSNFPRLLSLMPQYFGPLTTYNKIFRKRQVTGLEKI